MWKSRFTDSYCSWRSGIICHCLLSGAFLATLFIVVNNVLEFWLCGYLEVINILGLCVCLKCNFINWSLLIWNIYVKMTWPLHSYCKWQIYGKHIYILFYVNIAERSAVCCEAPCRSILQSSWFSIHNIGRVTRHDQGEREWGKKKLEKEQTSES